MFAAKIWEEQYTQGLALVCNKFKQAVVAWIASGHALSICSMTLLWTVKCRVSFFICVCFNSFEQRTQYASQNTWWVNNIAVSLYIISHFANKAFIQWEHLLRRLSTLSSYKWSIEYYSSCELSRAVRMESWRSWSGVVAKYSCVEYWYAMSIERSKIGSFMRGLHSYSSAPICCLELRCQHIHTQEALVAVICLCHSNCTVSMLCAYAVSSLCCDSKTRAAYSARQDKSHSVTPRLPSCGSCNQYLFVVAAVPMMF